MKFFKNKISIVQYKNNDSFTKKISSACDARVIWGGDKTVNEIRNFKLQEIRRYFLLIDILYV